MSLLSGRGSSVNMVQSDCGHSYNCASDGGRVRWVLLSGFVGMFIFASVELFNEHDLPAVVLWIACTGMLLAGIIAFPHL